MLAKAPHIKAGRAIVIGEGSSQWLTKSQQLKERAVATADRTRRKHLLLIAAEYQKLACQEDGGLALASFERLARARIDSEAPLGVVATLPVTPRRQQAVSDIAATRLTRLASLFRRPGVVQLTIWVILVLISFVLLLAPGDQTIEGLHELLRLLAE